MIGTIARIFPYKGYLFIHTKAGIDYFANASWCSHFGSLRIHDTVIFDVNASSDRPQAINVQKTA
jgi:cold shock CspA family protein